ncbi:MAG: hypothetical protein WBV82_00600 [Myxococcaceae bacterium]
MENTHTDPSDEHVLRLTTQEAAAIEKRLRLDRELKPSTTERVRCIYFSRAAPRTFAGFDANEHEIQVRVWERSSRPDEVVLEICRAFALDPDQVRIPLPRAALRPAMRANVLQELSPGLPHDLVPMLGIEMSRRAWTHPDGWWLALDRDIALHRLHPRVLERTGQIALGIPDKCIEGSVAFTLGRKAGLLPDWVERLASASAPWNLFRDGLALAAPRPSGASVAPGLRLVLQ